MVQYIKYVIKNKEPLRIGNDSTSQSGQTITLRYIPGTTIRGWVINQLSNGSDFEKLKEELFSDQVRYLNAYLSTSEQELIPSPKGFYEDKTIADGKKKIENVILNGDFSEGYKRASLGRFCYIQQGCIHYYNVATDSDMKIKMNLKKGETQTVFRNEYIKPGHCFTGYIAVKKQETAEIIKKLFDRKQIIIGNARSAGFGKCQIMSCKIIHELPYEKYLPVKEQKKSCYMMLLSNTVLMSETGEICGFTDEKIKELEEKMKVENLEIAYCSTSTVNVSGYNRNWGIKIPSAMTYEQGSVFHLKYDGVLTVETMKELVDTGIGIRHNEGFGRILFLDDYETVQYKISEKYDSMLEREEKKEKLSDDDEHVLRMAAKTYYTNIIRRKMQEYVLKKVKEKSFWGVRTSNSQLGTLDSKITANKYNVKQAKKAIDEYLEHANAKESGNRVQKQHNSLKETKSFIDEIWEKDIEQIIGSCGKEKGYIMGISTKDLLSMEEQELLKLELLTNLIRLKNKEDK